MSADQDGCEWVNVSSGTGLPGLNGCVRVCVFQLNINETAHTHGVCIMEALFLCRFSVGL